MRLLNTNIRIILLAAVLIFTTKISAQNFRLLKDINTISNSNPGANKGSFDSYNTYPPFTVGNDFALFNAEDGNHGRELWRTDGTEVNTYLVKDISSGESSSDPQNIIFVNGRFFFSAIDSVDSKLYVSDGTAGGTRLFKDVYRPILLTVVNNRFFFASQKQLWVSDGTEEGTNMLIDFSIPNESYLYGSFTKFFSANDKLYFPLYIAPKNGDPQGNRLWCTDGTSAGTHIVSNEADNPDQVTTSGGLVYFTAQKNHEYERRLWVIDKASGLAQLAKGCSKSGNVYRDTRMLSVDSLLYFVAGENNVFNTLYKYQSDTALLVKTFLPALTFTEIYGISQNGDELFLSVKISDGNISSKSQLWKSDGTEFGTQLLKDSCQVTRASVLNNKLYFYGGVDNTSLEPWISDGTSAGTRLIKVIYSGRGTSGNNYSVFTLVNNHIIFPANDNKSGIELWKTDGTEMATMLLKDINVTSTDPTYIFDATPVAEGLFFGSHKGIGATELWKTDGTTSGTVHLKGLQPAQLVKEGDAGFAQLHNSIYFFGLDSLQKKQGLCVSDGTTDGTFLLKALPGKLYATWLKATENLIYMGVQDVVSSKKYLWCSNGTEQGTYQIAELPNEVIFSNRLNLKPVAVGNVLFFVVKKYGGNELWKSEGTTSSTGRVKDIYPSNDPAISDLLYFKGKFFFAATDENGRHLFTSDGTENGTDAVTAGDLGINQLTAVGDNIFFSGRTGSQGYDDFELWKSDGTALGTSLVKDIFPGSSGSKVDNIINVNGIAFFIAQDDVHGRELWKSDGTNAGTVMIRDITPGNASTFSYDPFYGKKNKIALNGNLFININRLWVSDGTEEGTLPFYDENVKDVTSFYLSAKLNDLLFLSGDSYRYGKEMYVGRVEAPSQPLYIFNGSGNVSDPVNWVNEYKPPRVIAEGVEVIIAPLQGKDCILDIPITLKGGKLTVKKNAKLIIQSK